MLQKEVLAMRIYNFSAGPSMLPLPVLEQAAREMTDYNGSGMSVMEMSHRSPVYEAIINQTESDFRTLLGVPENYKVLFLQGGATTQFSAVPLNLMKTGKADYIVSGSFSGKAAKEAEKYGQVTVLASSKADNFTYVPYVDKFSPDADYVHICYNNTIYGTTFHYVPKTGDIPLVADMSSYIMSQPVNVNDFGVIYAGAQKNMAPAGLTVVIVREDLLGFARPETPVMLDWKIQADNGSMYNTPPAYTIYVAGLVYKWLLGLGGLEEMKKINERKAKVLYDYLDQSKLFKPTAKKENRSLMNVCFVTGDPDLDKKFCSEAAANGFVNIKGHRSVGGMRASIYNAMPEEGVKALVEFMDKFERNNKQ
ncbi:MAG: 3-phosphoserine/phosphohydroxythreonine transaminase [Clostridia bacterium]|nr:3-phosphoserine/phosphohydroxythreonine transaminase [Clostridia bacterium]MBP5238662.1 3-phosphoserine/phosphohydroxythreonine transaminase [Clostridia bacterium]